MRAWLYMLEADHTSFDDELPMELVEVYLTDDDAEPLHDCERCGIPVPVRAIRRCGHEVSIVRQYFPACPCCGGKTGRFAYWSGRTRGLPN